MTSRNSKKPTKSRQQTQYADRFNLNTATVHRIWKDEKFLTVVDMETSPEFLAQVLAELEADHD